MAHEARKASVSVRNEDRHVIWRRGSRVKRQKEREAKKRAETLLEYAADDWKYWSRFESVKGPHRAPSPHLLAALGREGPSDPCPVFIAPLCSSPTARPFAHTHNVSFFLVPGPVRVIGPLHGHLQPSFSSRDVIQGAHLPSPFVLIFASRFRQDRIDIDRCCFCNSLLKVVSQWSGYDRIQCLIE